MIQFSKMGFLIQFGVLWFYTVCCFKVSCLQYVEAQYVALQYVGVCYVVLYVVIHFCVLFSILCFVEVNVPSSRSPNTCIRYSTLLFHIIYWIGYNCRVLLYRFCDNVLQTWIESTIPWVYCK